MFESKDVKNMEGKFFGVYRAIIANVNDPEKLGRIKVYCPAVYGEGVESGWVLPAIQFIGMGFGLYCIPPSSIQGRRIYVWIQFEMGDPNYPIWFGSPIGQTNGLSELNKNFRKKNDGSDRQTPNNYGIITPGGHRIELDDDKSSNEIRITHAKGTRLVLDDGGVTVDGALTINEGCKVLGGLTVGGTAKFESSISVDGSVSASSVTSKGEVTGNGKKLSSHKHTDSVGGSTTTPL